jgi:hypothetical protein
MIGAAAAYSPSRCGTDGAGGFLPGVPLDCLDMASQRRPQRRVAGQPHVAASRKVTGVILSVKMTRFRQRKYHLRARRNFNDQDDAGNYSLLRLRGQTIFRKIVVYNLEYNDPGD